jgi:WD40 repeat protein
METSSQSQRRQTQEELDLHIIDLPESFEASSIRHAWLWHTLLHVQRAVNPRAFRLIQTCFTLLLALLAMLLLLSSILHPFASSPVITPDQHDLFASTSDATMVEVWDATTGQHLLTYQNHDDIVSDVQWSPNNRYIASTSFDSTVHVWNSRTGKLLFLYEGHSGVVTSLAWSPDSALIASGGQDGTIQVWNAFGGQSIITFLSQATSVAWSPGGAFIASGGTDGLVKLWFITRPTFGEHAVHESL